MEQQKIIPGSAQTLEHAHILSPQHLQSLRALYTPIMELSSGFEDVLRENPLISTDPDDDSDPRDGDTAAGTDADSTGGEDDDAGSGMSESGQDADTFGDDTVDFRIPDEGLPPGGMAAGDADYPDGMNESCDENRLDYDEELGRILEEDDAWSSVQPDGGGGDEDAGKHRDYVLDSIVGEVSLQERLMEQLRLEECTDEVRRAAEEIIGSIDSDGFFRSVPAEIAQSVPCSLETAETALCLVQAFDPPGVGARDAAECLMLQLEREGREDEPIGELVRHHLDDLGHNRLPKIAKDMGLSIPEVESLAAELRRVCNPRPAASLEPVRTEYCPVEVTVERENGEYAVHPNRESLPHFLIPKRYLRMLEDPDTPQDAKDFIMKNLKNLKDIRKALSMREKTIVRIARLIVSAQYDFFDKGPQYLKPMTMRDIADRLGLHETTVSRAIANKYMASPAGTFKFRDFFTGGYQNTEGDDVSSSAVKQYIREALSAENPSHPLSDSALAALLKQKGLDVARRTVAKYREELGYPSSQGRKKFA